MVQEEEYRFDAPEEKGGFGKFIWNSETREFCGRDGASWGKISLFYAIFYACLGSFFVGMLAVFVSFMPRDKPTYYGEQSTMNIRGLNPGLGFRPQIDVEDCTIIYNPKVIENKELGYRKYVDNLNIFLDAKYGEVKDKENVMKCETGHKYSEDLKSGKSCEFDYKAIFANTECNKENDYGFKSSKPCILIKLNKIISWEPESANGSVAIRCDGETSVDKDNIKSVQYFSEGSSSGSSVQGEISAKYFPFFAQKSYRAPFVWAQFDLSSDALVNIECKAYADNIDNSDRLNRRGQTKFSLLVSSIF